MTITTIFYYICGLLVYVLIPNQAMAKKYINLPEFFYKLGTVVGGCHHDFAFNLKLPINIANFLGQNIIRGRPTRRGTPRLIFSFEEYFYLSNARSFLNMTYA